MLFIPNLKLTAVKAPPCLLLPSLFFCFFFNVSGQDLVLEIPQIVIVLLILNDLALFIYWWSASSNGLPDASWHLKALKGTFLTLLMSPDSMWVFWANSRPLPKWAYSGKGHRRADTWRPSEPREEAAASGGPGQVMSKGAAAKFQGNPTPSWNHRMIE